MSSRATERSKSLDSGEETDRGVHQKHQRGHQDFDWLRTPRKDKRERLQGQPAEGDQTYCSNPGPSGEQPEQDQDGVPSVTGFIGRELASTSLTTEVLLVDAEQEKHELDQDLEEALARTGAVKHLRFDKELVWAITPRKRKKNKLSRSNSLDELTSGLAGASRVYSSQTTSQKPYIDQATNQKGHSTDGDPHNNGIKAATQVSSEFKSQELEAVDLSGYIRNSRERKKKGIWSRLFNTKNKNHIGVHQGKLYQLPINRKLEYDTLSLPSSSAKVVEMQPMGEEATTSGSQPFRLVPLSQLWREKAKVSGPELATYAEYAKLILDSNLAEHKAFLRDYLATLQELEIEKARARPQGVTELDRELVNLPRSAQTTIKRNELVLTPEIFDGERPKPRRWLTDYGEAILANGWSDHLAVKYLPTFLSRSAKDWYFTEVRPRLTTDTRWSHIHEMFTNNYLGESDYVELSRAIERASQRPDERAANFIPRLRRLLQMLSPDIGELEMVRKLKEKLRPEYRQLVNLQPTRTIAELKDLCARIESGLPEKANSDRRAGESVSKGSRSTKGSLRSTQTRSERPKTLAVTTRPELPRKGTVRMSTGSRQPWPKKESSAITCYNCNKPGHIAKDCTLPRQLKTDARHVRVVERKNEEAPDTDYVEVVPHAYSKRKTVATIEPAVIAVVGSCNYIYKELKCNGTRVQAAIDSGAKISVVRADVVKANDWIVNGPVIPLHGADGKLMEAQRSIYLDVEMSTNRITKKKKHLFAIMTELTEPMLVGRDLLRSLEAVIDHATDNFSFSKTTLKSGVRVGSEKMVPARSQAIITAKANTVGTILIKPFEQTCGVRIANSITDVVNSEVPLLALNYTDAPIKLKCNTQLGSYEALEEPERIEFLEGPELRPINQIISLEDTTEVIQVGDQLSHEQVDQLRTVIERNREAFSLHGELGNTSVFEHKIELLPGASPFAEPLRRRAQVQIDETRKQVNDMLDQGIIEESSSPWASAYVLAKKKNGEYRLCIDFRRLNAATKRTVYPLPNIDECLDTLSGKRYFTQLDFKSGFWQIPMDPKSKELTAFRTEDGLFQFNRMPFGLTNAPASFQKMAVV